MSEGAVSLIFLINVSDDYLSLALIAGFHISSKLSK